MASPPKRKRKNIMEADDEDFLVSSHSENEELSADTVGNEESSSSSSSLDHRILKDLSVAHTHLHQAEDTACDTLKLSIISHDSDADITASSCPTIHQDSSFGEIVESNTSEDMSAYVISNSSGSSSLVSELNRYCTSERSFKPGISVLAKWDPLSEVNDILETVSDSIKPADDLICTGNNSSDSTTTEDRNIANVSPAGSPCAADTMLCIDKEAENTQCCFEKGNPYSFTSNTHCPLKHVSDINLSCNQADVSESFSLKEESQNSNLSDSTISSIDSGELTGQDNYENLDFDLSNSDSDSSASVFLLSPSESDSESVTSQENNHLKELQCQSDFVLLHNFTPLTRDDAILEVLNVYLKNKSSKACLGDILSAVCHLLPEPHTLPKSKFKLLQYVQRIAPQRKEIQHHYCSVCQSYLGTVSEPILCPVCERVTDSSVFWELDLCDAVVHFFEYRNLATVLDEKYQSNIDQNAGFIKDVTDGSVYRLLNTNRSKYDLNFILNCDGVRLRKSSVYDLWLLMVMPIEVPLHLRESFITIIGVWYDSKQPNMNTFLKPFCKKLRSTFESGGLQWKHPVSGELCTSKILTPLVVADAPARAKLQNISNFNGRFGCNLCEVKTVKAAPVPGKKSVYVYAKNFKSPLREGQRMITQGRLAVERGEHVKGVKGPSILSILEYVDISQCFIPEYMHSVLLGVVRQLSYLWFNKPGPWSCKNFIIDINNILKSIKPPNFIHRKPRDLNALKVWKASEYHNWLLYFSLPVLKGYLPQRFYEHYMLLVRSMFTLLKSSISFSEIEETELLLQLFVQDMEDLYGDREMTYNVHQILHLCLSVKRWGPLSRTSAFAFENVNGVVSHRTHGTKHIAKEIVNNIRFAEGFNILKSRVEKNNNVSLNVEKARVFRSKISVELKDTERALLLSVGILDSHAFYAKAQIGREVYASTSYKKLKSADFHVSWLGSENIREYGSIRFFVELDDDIFILIDKYAIQHVDVLYHSETRKEVKHILPIIDDHNDNVLLQFSRITEFRKEIRVGNYICERPNYFNQVL